MTIEPVRITYPRSAWLQRDLHVLLHEQDRQPVGPQRVERGEDLRDHLRRETERRLVEQQRGRDAT